MEARLVFKDGVRDLAIGGIKLYERFSLCCVTMFGERGTRLFVCVYMTELAKYHAKSKLSLLHFFTCFRSPPHKCIAQALCEFILVFKSHKNLHSISTLHISTNVQK